MRVVAGTAGGRRLQGPSSADVRPTTDKVREAMFNALQSADRISGAQVVDLYAGTGACGIEALSRGAASATFVDSDPGALRVVRNNLTITGFEGDVVKSDVLGFLRRGREFDVAFVDPPYVFTDWSVLLDALHARTAVCESSSEITFGSRWKLVRHKRYGISHVTILEAAA